MAKNVPKNERNSTKDFQERSEALAKMIKMVDPIYHRKGTTRTQKDFIETTIGAALFYCYRGKRNALWTMEISADALRAFAADKSFAPTDEHFFPRKLAGKELLERSHKQEMTGAQLGDLFVTKYGRFTRVTSQENRRLAPFQKNDVFVSPKRAYREAGVQMIKVTEEEWKRIKRGDKELINKLLGK